VIEAIFLFWSNKLLPLALSVVIQRCVTAYSLPTVLSLKVPAAAPPTASICASRCLRFLAGHLLVGGLLGLLLLNFNLGRLSSSPSHQLSLTNMAPITEQIATMLKGTSLSSTSSYLLPMPDLHSTLEPKVSEALQELEQSFNLDAEHLKKTVQQCYGSIKLASLLRLMIPTVILFCQ
jgi:hypothetical protein